MSTKELTPISIRLNDCAVNTLKYEARRISYERNTDVSYVDLIRDAVSLYMKDIEKELSEEEIIHSIAVEEITVNSTTQSHEILELLNLNENEWLSLFGLNFNSPLTIAMRNAMKPTLEKMSLPRSVLPKISSAVQIKRPLCSKVLFISRRGVIPENIVEGETFTPTIFLIACNPSLSFDEIFAKEANIINQVAHVAATSIAQEESRNFHALLEATELSVQVDTLNIDNLYKGYELLLQNGRKSRNLLLSPMAFLKLAKEANKYKGNWEFCTLTGDTSTVGHFYGAEIKTCDYFSEYEAYFMSDSECEGFIEKQSSRVLVCPDIKRLRGGFIIWVELGMFMDSMTVSCVTSEKARTEEICGKKK
ncbi:hypothetical protein LCGC14_0932730 [marine sediment metagenome]|uniref:Uncharacterized protein n=1 Tax=marine sediment metagenome TaxID=412755 RepID=A0A0F9R5X0_9ZZZZ